MRFKTILLTSTILASSTIFSITQAAVSLSRHDLSKTDIPFLQNIGQTNSKVAFYAQTFGGKVYVTKEGKLVYSLPAFDSKGERGSQIFRESFVSTTQLRPAGSLSVKVNVSQFKGNKPKKWQQHIPGFEEISLGEVFKGVRVTLRAKGSNVEKLFHVSPGSDPRHIRVGYEGIDGLSINNEQQLVLSTRQGDILFSAPVAYQLINNKKSLVDVKYALLDNNNAHYGFSLGNYNPDYELVIDPLLASTFVGGVNANPPQYNNYDYDIAYAVFVDGAEIYVGGVTQSTDFPVLLGFDSSANSSGKPDGFIARFSSDLSTLYSATYFGTEEFDRVSDLAKDIDGTIVAVGQAGYQFPVTTGAFNHAGSAPGWGGFVAKFSADLSTLIASSTVIPSDYPTSVAIGNGGIYFGGETNAPNLPVTEGALHPTCICTPSSSYGLAPTEGFIGKISSDLASLQALTYLGGDNLTSITVAPDSSIYVTDGKSTLVTGSGLSTGVVGRLDADLTTNLGLAIAQTSTSSRTYYNDLVLGDDFAVVVGTTGANDLPVSSNAFQSSCGTGAGCNAAFIAKYSLDLTTLQAFTYFGGNGLDIFNSVDLDPDGNIVVAGKTYSTDLPTTANAHDRLCGSGTDCSDIYVAKFSSDLSQLFYGSYLGGSEAEDPGDMTVAADGTVYVVGSTHSANYPTTAGAFDRTYAGGAVGVDALGFSATDAVISQFDMNGSSGGNTDPGSETNVAPIADAGLDQTVGSRANVSLNANGSNDSDGTVVQYQWQQISGKAVNLNNNTQVIANFRAPRLRRGREYTLVFELTVTDNANAIAKDQVTILVK